jgi:hypothetical protein
LDNAISSESAQKKQSAIAKTWACDTSSSRPGSPTISLTFPSVIANFRGSPFSGFVGESRKKSYFDTVWQPNYWSEHIISFWPRIRTDNYGRYYFPLVDIHKGETSGISGFICSCLFYL